MMMMMMYDRPVIQDEKEQEMTGIDVTMMMMQEFDNDCVY